MSKKKEKARYRRRAARRALRRKSTLQPTWIERLRRLIEWGRIALRLADVLLGIRVEGAAECLQALDLALQAIERYRIAVQLPQHALRTATKVAYLNSKEKATAPRSAPPPT